MAKIRLTYSGIYFGDLQHNPEDTRLRNHSLHKTMENKWAFSIRGDIRIVYVWIGKRTVRFLAIGGHEGVYTRKKKPD